MKIRKTLISAVLVAALLVTCFALPMGGAAITNDYRLGSNWVLESVYDISQEALSPAPTTKNYTFNPAGDISEADYIAVRVKTGATAVGAAATVLAGSANYKGVHLNQGLLITLDGEISVLESTSHNYSGIPANFDGYMLFDLYKCICSGGGNGVRRDDFIKRVEPYDLGDTEYGVDLKHITGFAMGINAEAQGVYLGGAAAVKLVSKIGAATVQYGKEFPGINFTLTDGYYTYTGTKYFGFVNEGATADISSYRYIAFPVKTTAAVSAVQFFCKNNIDGNANWDISFYTGKLVSADGTVTDITANSNGYMVDIPANFDGLVLIDMSVGKGSGGIAMERVGDDLCEVTSGTKRVSLVNGLPKVYARTSVSATISIGQAFPANLTVATGKFTYGDYTLNITNDLPGEWTNNGNAGYTGLHLTKTEGTTNFAAQWPDALKDLSAANYMAVRVKNTGIATGTTGTFCLKTDGYTTGVYLTNGFALSLDGTLTRFMPSSNGGYQFAIPANFDGFLLFQLDTAVGYSLNGHKVQRIGKYYYDISDRTNTAIVSDLSKFLRYDFNVVTTTENSAVYVGDFYGVTLDIETGDINIGSAVPAWSTTARTYAANGFMTNSPATSGGFHYVDTTFSATDISDASQIIVRFKNGDVEIPAGTHAYIRSEDGATYGNNTTGVVYMNHVYLMDLEGNVTTLTAGTSDFNWKAIPANFDGYIVIDISEGLKFTPSGGGMGAQRVGNAIKAATANNNFAVDTVIVNLERFNYLRLGFKDGSETEAFNVGFIGAATLSDIEGVKTDAIPVPVDPTITNSENLEVEFNNHTDKAVSVDFTEAANTTYTYQWYVSTTDADANDGTAIEGATSKSYTIPADEEIGTKYYYCIVKATIEGGRETAVAIGKKITLVVTPAATPAPTPVPTPVPTDEPTAPPTAEPTAPPTAEPTTPPTSNPNTGDITVLLAAMTAVSGAVAVVFNRKKND